MKYAYMDNNEVRNVLNENWLKILIKLYSYYSDYNLFS